MNASSVVFYNRYHNTAGSKYINSPPPLDKMTAISQMIFSYAYLLIKSFVFYIKISPQCVDRGFKWQWTSIGTYNGLASKRRQAIIWTNADMHIYLPPYWSTAVNFISYICWCIDLFKWKDEATYPLNHLSCEYTADLIWPISYLIQITLHYLDENIR